MDPRELQQQVVDLCAGVKTRANPLLPAALLHTLMVAHGFDGAALVKGYAISVENKTFRTHVWVRFQDLDLDPTATGLVLSRQPPPDPTYRRLDEDTKDHLLSVYEFYLKYPTSYWAGAPRAIQRQRREWLRHLAASADWTWV